MPLESTAYIIGFLGTSLAFFAVALTFMKERPAFMPLRLLYFFVGLFILLYIPAILNNVTWANDAVNSGVFNTTQVNSMVLKSNSLYEIVWWSVLITLFYVIFWYFFFRLREDVEELIGPEIGRLDRTFGRGRRNR